MNDIYHHQVPLPDGTQISLGRWRGDLLLIVNVASKCGFTPQYEGLEALYQKYRNQKFTILAFPCNQFLRQEPGSWQEITAFCTSRYDVHFPIFQKINVNGPNTHPLFVQLKAAAPGILGSRAIKWNFTKFLVDRGGVPVQRFAPATPPARIQQQLKAYL